jgi:sialate O-acetylesterase
MLLMKSTLSCSCALALLASGVLLSACNAKPSTLPADESPQPDNLLTNPSFEAAAEADAVPGWTLNEYTGGPYAPIAAGEATVIDNPQQAHAGRKFLRVLPGTHVIAVRSPQLKRFEPGVYEVSAWMRGRPGMVAGFHLQPLNASGGHPQAITGQWQKYSTRVYTKGVEKYAWPDLTRFILQVRPLKNEPQAALDIDDVSVVRLTAGLADTFDDHTVLQRERPVPIWGWAKDVGQKVTVSFNGQTQSTQADKDGRWQVVLSPMKAGGPYVLELNSRATLYDVMVGDVWICSGQSNMEFGVDKLNGIWGTAPEVTDKADYPQLRLWQASKQFSATPLHGYQQRQDAAYNRFQATWNVCTPDTIRRGVWGGFSAVGYFFGREIQEDQKVAVGLMMIAHGGTPIESFISAEGLKPIPQEQWKVPPITPEVAATMPPLPQVPDGIEAKTAAYVEVVARLTDREAAKGAPKGKAFQYANAAYNGLVAPVFPMAVRGVLWFQGENNAGDLHYAPKLKALIADWRSRFGQKDLPFIVAQLCNWRSPRGDAGFQFVREAQFQVAQSDPHAALAVTIDLADKEGDGYGPGEIHFKDKQDVGHRMALAARALAYDEKLVSSGPLYKSMKVENGKIRLSFDSVGSGLEAKGDKLAGFSIAGADRKFVPADAVIDGQTVVVSTPQVAAPLAVRYGFAQFVHPLCNLYNKDGLPASPFRTDDWTVE